MVGLIYWYNFEIQRDVISSTAVFKRASNFETGNSLISVPVGDTAREERNR